VGLKHLFMLLLAGAVGGVVGAFVCMSLRHGPLHPLDELFWRNQLGAVIGASVTLAIACTTLVVSYARNSAAIPDGFHQSMRGIGSILIGKSDVAQDGSYWATEWLIVYYIPLFPIARYHVIKHPGSLWQRTEYTILAKAPPRLAEVARVYAIFLAVLSIMAAALMLYWRA
jgi:uncharacterized membrane protein YeaQ/YmgE (transglycosylase-associated protein family)